MARTYHPRGLLVDGYPVQEHPSYDNWALMLTRCTNPAATGYANYGGRGISVCPRWHHFANFAADMGIRPDGLSIDRIDNDGNYEPGNCKWSDRDEQAGNKRVYRTNKTGETGIRERDGKFQVRIIENGKRKSIGNYSTLAEAVAAKAARTRAASGRVEGGTARCASS